MSLYDRIFRPRRYTLSDGTVVEEKRSRAPLVILILVVLTAVSVRITGFNFSVLVKKGSKFFDILKAMFPPNTAYLGKIWQPLWDTIKMSFLGSFIGAVLAIPFAIAAASNIVTNRVVVFLVRLFLSLVRTLPTLVCALIATYIFGLGTMAGTCAIAVFTFAYVGKQLFEIIETVDMGPYEALEALGATRLRAFVTAVFPQVLPTYLSVSLFCYNSSIGKTRIKMQTFRIIAKNPSHENAASKLVPAAVRFFVLAKFVRSKQHSALLYETAVLLFFAVINAQMRDDIISSCRQRFSSFLLAALVRSKQRGTSLL